MYVFIMFLIGLKKFMFAQIKILIQANTFIHLYIHIYTYKQLYTHIYTYKQLYTYKTHFILFIYL